MVLINTLTSEEMKRHYDLIEDYFRTQKGTSDFSAEFVKNGAEKGIYRIRAGQEEFVAAAASRDLQRRVLQEYTVLHQLWNAAPEYFPRPHLRSCGAQQKE